MTLGFTLARTLYYPKLNKNLCFFNSTHKNARCLKKKILLVHHPFELSISNIFQPNIFIQFWPSVPPSYRTSLWSASCTSGRALLSVDLRLRSCEGIHRRPSVRRCTPRFRASQQLTKNFSDHFSLSFSRASITSPQSHSNSTKCVLSAVTVL